MGATALPFEKQIKHFMPATAIASEDNIEDFIASASNGEIAIYGEDGTLAGLAPNKDFYFVRKSLNGKILKSDLITPKDIKYRKKTNPRSKTGKTQVFTLSGITANSIITANLKINYAGSERNFVTMIADTKVPASGGSATTVLTDIAKNLATSLANDIMTSTNIAGTDTIIAGTNVKKNKYFTITVSGSTLTISEKDWILDGYVPGLKTYDQLSWNLVLTSSNDAQAAQISRTETAPVFATGQGYQMKEMERYLSAHRGDFYSPDQTVEFGYNSEIDVTKSYYMLDMRYFDVSTYDPYQSDKELIIVSTEESVITNLLEAVEGLMVEGQIGNLDSRITALEEAQEEDQEDQGGGEGGQE